MRKILRKGQTALEYLMTYGWAILIVIIAIGALYALGLTKPCRWTGTQITGFTGGGFEASLPRFDASTGEFVFDLKRIQANSVTYTNSSATYKTTTGVDNPADTIMGTGDSRTVTYTGFTGVVAAGDCYGVEVGINYTEPTAGGREFTAAGKISGTVEA